MTDITFIGLEGEGSSSKLLMDSNEATWLSHQGRVFMKEDAWYVVKTADAVLDPEQGCLSFVVSVKQITAAMASDLRRHR
jgi:hypothetical protein